MTLLLAQPLDTSDPLLMGEEERKAFLATLPRVYHYRPIGTTGYRGVVKFRSRYSSRIWHNKVSYYLGSFPTAEEAARAYDARARELHGEWAELNFPDEQAA